jgi:hypothetical protein
MAMAKSGACNSLIFYPLGPFFTFLSHFCPEDLHTCQRQGKNSKILLKLLNMQRSYECEQELVSTLNRHGCSLMEHEM